MKKKKLKRKIIEENISDIIKLFFHESDLFSWIRSFSKKIIIFNVQMNPFKILLNKNMNPAK